MGDPGGGSLSPQNIGDIIGISKDNPEISNSLNNVLSDKKNKIEEHKQFFYYSDTDKAPYTVYI